MFLTCDYVSFRIVLSFSSTHVHYTLFVIVVSSWLYLLAVVINSCRQSMDDELSVGDQQIERCLEQQFYELEMLHSIYSKDELSFDSDCSPVSLNTSYIRKQ